MLWIQAAGLVILAVTAPAATVKQEVFVSFDGTVSGTAYTPAAGEFDTTGTFIAQGTTLQVSGGTAILNPENNTSGLNDGFNFNGSGIIGTKNFIMEVVLSPDAEQFYSFANFMDICGNMFYRMRSNSLEFGY